MVRIRFRNYDGEWWATCMAMGLREHHVNLAKLFHRLAYVVPPKMKELGSAWSIDDDLG